MQVQDESPWPSLPWQTRGPGQSLSVNRRQVQLGALIAILR